ncbi:acyl-CoA synthetase [Croceicoccus sp. BE223]|uniref:acyl-CoA synthetase n=1 Tax=Croceicoccus sp. BE223 TaxID=2817716 RepID=UPI00285A965B|nr:acyl-CoA synthetase [Croceicoccus sp. BE223]MDR7104122.1 long-chain acyl-CoA synthetase [Croceicoccus sp. BE223]
MHPSVHAAATPAKPALIMAASGEPVTFEMLEDRSNRTAHLLRSLGLVRGDVIALLLDNRPEFFDLVWGAHRCGLYYVCISTQLLPAEIEFILQDCGAKVLFAAPGLDGKVADVARANAVDLFSVAGKTGRDYLAEREAMPATRIADESAGNDMLYSSGTTGRPKGIKPPLPDGPLAVPNGLTRLGESAYGMGPDTVFLSPAPLYHAAPLRWCMAVQMLGGTVVVMDKFDPEAALAAIERYGVTHAQWVPTHFVRMLKLPDEVRARYDCSTLRNVFHAAAPCPVEVKQAMIAWWGPIVHEFYGGTEANGLTNIGPQDWLRKPGSVGLPMWGTPKICDEDGNELPAGQTGTIYFADGQPFEYHNDPEKTAASRNAHGWTTIGDVGWLDEDGFLYLTDRKSYMIISGGVNIYPQEIENQLLLHPEVADAAVIGAPDPDLGERVVAVVQPADPDAAGPELAERITAFLRTKVGRIKVPRQVDFDPALPRTPTGKLMKRLVRDRYWPDRDGNPLGLSGGGKA